MKERADKILAERGFVASRSQAKSLIETGHVLVKGNLLKKAGELIESDARIEITSKLYVGRGAFKLEKALEVFKVEVRDKTFMDVGASTGGFTQVLLDQGAKKVFAIDVGHDQLSQKLCKDPRVVNMEGTNIKDILSLPELCEGAVMDLSFISITKVLETIKPLIRPSGDLVALVKPQFEAGKERLPKDGVIKDSKVQEEILEEVILFAKTHGWKHLQTIDSPIEGKAGNREFLCWFSNGA